MTARTGSSFGGGTWGKVLEFRPRKRTSYGAPASSRPNLDLPGRAPVIGVIDALRGEFHCLACDRSPEHVEVYADPMSIAYHVVAFCHGNRQTLEVEPDRWMKSGHEWVAKLVGEVRALFPHDSGPDMKELLRYNREGWK